MQIRVNNVGKIAGIPAARVAVSPGQTDLGVHQVNVILSAIDSWGHPTVVATLRLSSTEARNLAECLLASVPQ